MPVLIKREYDYAIRICAYLAGYYQQGPISVSKIAAKLYITRPFTTKIVYQLTKKKILATVQGKEGGIYLDQPPEKLSVHDILMAMGFNSTINECLKNPKLCPLMVTCEIHRFFLDQENQLIERLKQKKIAGFAFNDDNLSILHK